MMPHLKHDVLFSCQVCQRNNINYYWGPGTVTFVGCVLVE